MKDVRRKGYFTGWQYDRLDDLSRSHRIYYNDIDIATGDLLCDGEVVGNVDRVNRKMDIVDKRNNYMW